MLEGVMDVNFMELKKNERLQKKVQEKTRERREWEMDI